jgi:hypothetical protein
MALTSPPLQSTTSNHKVSKALISGVSVAGAVILAAIIAFTIWRRRRNNGSRESPVVTSMSNDHSTSIDEGKARDTYLPQIQSTPSRPYTVRESTPAGPPIDTSLFSNPTIVPSTPIFPPEIQSEDYPGHGNLPIRQTTALDLSEKRTIMARQGPGAPLNANSGFYTTSAISAPMNAKPSSNQLCDTTRVPYNQGISATMNF